MRTFLKENLKNAIKVNGNAVLWEPISPNQGVRNLSEAHDAALISLLDKEADLRRNGVRRISAEQYDSLKKNTNLVKSTPAYDVLPSIQLNDPESVLPKFRSPPPSLAVAPASPPPAPVAPTPAPQPPVEGKPSETPARAKAKRGKLSDLLAKEKAVAEQ